MISVSDIQAAFVTSLKADTLVTAVMLADEIRENQWQGKDFTYPNVRIDMLPERPATMSNCEGNYVDVLFRVFSEQTSSKEANDIAVKIANKYHNKSFPIGTLRFMLVCSSLVPANRIDTKTWEAQVRFTGTAIIV